MALVARGKLRIFKAQGIGDREAIDLNVKATEPFPECETLEIASRLFNSEAEALENILHDSLPGGTYSSLLRFMLERRASHFVVSFANPKEGE